MPYYRIPGPAVKSVAALHLNRQTIAMPNECDVLIVGGGVAGCAVGTFLAQSGLRVLILEKGSHPRHHIGESLLPASMPILESLGIGMQEMARHHQPKYGARFCDASDAQRCETFAFNPPGGPPPAFQVLRAEFDVEIKGRCTASGCQYEENRLVTSWHPTPGGVEVFTSNQQIYHARFLVIATGRSRLNCSAADGVSDARDISNRFGHLAIYNYYPNLPPAVEDERFYITIHLAANGWIWCIPLSGGDTSIGVVLKNDGVQPGLNHRAQFEHALQGCPSLYARLRDIGPRDEFRSAADYSYRSAARYGPGWLKVGDAGGFLDPIFSSGVHLALSSAQMAAPAIIEYLKSADTAQFKTFGREMDWAENVFENFIDRFYNRDLAWHLFFASYKRPHIKAAITSLLAGHVWDRSNPVVAMFAANRCDISAPAETVPSRVNAT